MRSNSGHNTSLMSNWVSMMINQILKFGVVGTLAAGVHLISVFVLSGVFDMHPLAANPIGFVIAFIVSFLGHSGWTFSDSAGADKKSLLRFFSTAIFALLLTQLLYLLILEDNNENYLSALFFILIFVSGFTFIISRFWAFPKQ